MPAPPRLPPLALAAILTPLVVVGFLAWNLANVRANAIHGAEVRAAARADAIRQGVGGLVKQVDLLLLDLREYLVPGETSDGPAGVPPARVEEMRRRIRAAMPELPAVLSVHIAGADGRCIFSSDDAVPAASVAERACFQRQREAAGDRLEISEPLFDPASRRWEILPSRRLVDARGRFAGVILATVDAATLGHLIRPPDDDGKWTMAVLDRQGRLVARVPERPELVGRAVDDRQLAEAVARGADRSFHGLGLGVGEPQCWALAVPAGSPLAFAAGHSLPVALAAWRRQLPVHLLVALVVAGGTAAILWLMRRQRESELAYRTMFDTAQDALFVIDQNLRFVDVNRTACERLGHPRQRLLAMGPADIDAPETAARIPAVVERLHRDGQAVFTGEHRRADGSAIPVEVNASLTTFRGRPAILCIARDLSVRLAAERDRAAAQAELRAKTAEVDRFFDLALDLLCIAGMDGRFRWLNPSWESCLGYPLAELVGARSSSWSTPRTARRPCGRWPSWARGDR